MAIALVAPWRSVTAPVSTRCGTAGFALTTADVGAPPSRRGPERARLQSRFVAGAVRLAELLVADDSLTEAQRVLARVQAEDPASESASALAIGLYVKAGDRAAALREYRRIEALLAELELTPSPQLLAAAGSLRP